MRYNETVDSISDFSEKVKCFHKKGGIETSLNTIDTERTTLHTPISDFLDGYRTQERMLLAGSVDEYGEPVPLPLYEESCLRAGMYRVLQFVRSLENGPEKLFLYCRYIRGATVEECAEALGYSRSHMYRIRKRALELAEREARAQKLL
jgi:hypothetical protein